MKERINLSRNIDAGDVSARAFRPNYMYLHEDGITLYFEPNFITPLRLVYPGQDVVAGPDRVVMSEAMANAFKRALGDALALCKDRFENPFVPPAPRAPNQGESNGSENQADAGEGGNAVQPGARDDRAGALPREAGGGAAEAREDVA